MDKVTFDDVYEIAAEVAEETIKKFLTNLVKLVPAAEDVVSEIKEEQYEELRQLRQGKLQETRVSKRAPVATAKKSSAPIIPTEEDDEEDFYSQQDDEFAQIAHPVTNSTANAGVDIDEALSQITLEKSENLSTYRVYIYNTSGATLTVNDKQVAAPYVSDFEYGSKVKIKSELDGYKTLTEGQYVEFNLVETPKGYQALDVVVIKEATPAK